MPLQTDSVLFLEIACELFDCAMQGKRLQTDGGMDVHSVYLTTSAASACLTSKLHSSPLQETYLMKHMRKHNPDPLSAAAVVSAQQSQQQPQGGGGGGQGRGERGQSGAAVAGSNTGAGGGQAQNQGNHNTPSSYPQADAVSCPFDLHQYKTVSAGDIQYKPVSVAELTAHKDLCLTVSTSTIQVEHLNS